MLHLDMFKSQAQSCELLLLLKAVVGSPATVATCNRLKSLTLNIFFLMSTRLIKLILNYLFDKMHSLNPYIL